MKAFARIAAAFILVALVLDLAIYLAARRAVRSVLRANLEAPAHEKLPQVLDSMRVGLSRSGRAVLKPYLQGCLVGFGALYAAALDRDGRPIEATANFPSDGGAPGGAREATTRERTADGRPILELSIPVTAPESESGSLLGALVLGFSLAPTLELEARIARRATVLAALASAAALAALLLVIRLSSLALSRGEERLRQSEKLSALGHLTAGVAHEINNPLGSILGFAQAALRRDDLSPPLQAALKAIEEESRRCRRLVQDLLVFSRREDAAASRFDLEEAIEGTLAMLESQARLIDVVVERESGVRLQLRGHKSQIQQVLVNLASNALDAMPRGGRLTVRTRRTALSGRPAAAVEVSDTGSGIPADIFPRIFEPFFTTKPTGRGTGLGLAIVQEIVQRHHGAVEARAAPGGGTIFVAIFPLDPGV